jgi:hypothetical protein
MPDDHALQTYLSLANDIFLGKIHVDAIDRATRHLPPLNENLLEQLAQAAEEAALLSPRSAWTISLLADSAARDGDLRLQSRAAWYLGRVCNHLGQPGKVSEAIQRARRGFESLGETAWLAACDWQLNHLAWTKPNFAEAASQLESALAVLEQSELEDFAQECRLSLSYAQILCGNFVSAQENLTLCKEIFTARQDRLNLARCWLNEASLPAQAGKF